ncbi:MAG: segregation/condensation protein A [Chlamydiota bacterium]
MKKDEAYSVRLENFEGPLEFLLYLVQKNELDIYDVRLVRIVNQFIDEMKSPNIDLGAEFIGTLASLLWLKSKMLLPKHEQVGQEDEDGPDPHFDVIHQLIDYCQFKEAGQALVVREKEQNAYFPRGVSGDIELKKPLGIEHLCIEDLASLFQDILIKCEANKGQVHEEHFRVSDKIRLIRRIVKSGERILFRQLFTPEKCKDELIVTFLAILELMKIGEAFVYKDLATQQIFIAPEEIEGGDDE